MITETSVLAPRPDLIVEGFDDAVLVWDEAGSRLHHLDLFASIVWDELDGRRDIADVASELARDFPNQHADVAVDILELLRRLHVEGLVALVAT